MKIGTYRLTKEEAEAVKSYLAICGFELMETEKVVNKKTFYECLELNKQWLWDMANDAITRLPVSSR